MERWMGFFRVYGIDPAGGAGCVQERAGSLEWQQGWLPLWVHVGSEGCVGGICLQGSTKYHDAPLGSPHRSGGEREPENALQESLWGQLESGKGERPRAGSWPGVRLNKEQH